MNRYIPNTVVTLLTPTGIPMPAVTEERSPYARTERVALLQLRGSTLRCSQFHSPALVRGVEVAPIGVGEECVLTEGLLVVVEP